MGEKEALIDEVARHELALLRLMARDRSAPLLATTLTIQQLKVLLLLHLEGSTSAHELADSLGVSMATVTGIVDRLVDRDLVTRTEDPDDRRVRRISLAAEGVRLTEELMTAGQAQRRRVLLQLDVETLAGLARATAAVHAAAEAVLRDHVSAEPSGESAADGAA
jgi:DNA-binding MarR family transcriptional regulator